jgi:uncharacterized protein (DUF1501 family)
MKRRLFLKAAAAGSVLPVSLNGMSVRAYANSPLMHLLGRRTGSNDNVLVLIQLNGGNDGLNTVIPLDQYTNLTKARSNVIIQDTKVLKLNGVNGTGLHPAMTGLQGLYNNGLVNIIQDVGYPNPNFSHFRSTDIWMSGSDTSESWTTGWMGRYLDSQFPGFPDGYPNTGAPDPPAIQIGSMVSLATMGASVNMGMAITDPSNFYTLVNGTTDPVPNTPAGRELEFLRIMANQTNQYATSIKNAATKATTLSTKYPTGNNLADQLKIVARLIKGGLKTQVYMVSIGGFDTHSQQVDNSDHSIGAHATLLQRVSDAITAFQDDLTLMGIQDRVAGMTFSEFGRRIMSNGSVGTDHGAAAPMIAFGTGVQRGVIGRNPVIPDTVTVNDNVPMQYDFRQVYASALQDWFGLSKTEVKAAMGGKDFNTLPVFKANPAGIEDFADLVSRLYLHDVYPNPAQGEANFRFFTDGGNVELCLFDPLGNRIRTMASGKHGMGEHEVRLDVRGLRPGNYFYQLSQGNRKLTKVLVVAN